MFGSVPVSPRALEDYRPILGDERVEELRKLGDGLRGARVLHVNSTAFGGGVAELLSSLVPLMNDLGLAADWQVMKGADEFFQVTKVMHNALQGMFIPWLPQMQDIWLRYNQLNADLFDDHYDFVVVHDPQPAGLRLMTRQRFEGEGTKWIWRC
ncbi:MAG: glycosyl transferase family 1, partial [Chloroflexi bacterium]|nr:glycosyl transferase family 1 [Chloroflexota bacterium]